MRSIILDLQKELLQTDCDILLVLRKAHVIASKLQLDEFDSWIQSELNGYECTIGELPKYRKIPGVVQAFNPFRGWIPCRFESVIMGKAVSTAPLFDALSTLIEMGKTKQGKNLTFSFTNEYLQMLEKHTKAPIDMDMRIIVDASAVNSIAEVVKNKLLEWTLQLEKIGIKGKNMEFNDTEKDIAKNNIKQINLYGDIVFENAEQLQIMIADKVSLNYSEIQRAVTELREKIICSVLDERDQESALAMIDDISQKLMDKEKPSVIKTAAKALGSFLMNVGANTLAGIILSKI